MASFKKILQFYKTNKNLLNLFLWVKWILYLVQFVYATDAEALTLLSESPFILDYKRYLETRLFFYDLHRLLQPRA